MLQPSDRLRNLGVYALAKVFAARDEQMARGVDVIDLGVGNPDRRPPEHVVQALKGALDDPAHQNHRYPAFGGMPEFRESIAAWYERRFGVQLDPAREVLPLIGSKEGIVKFFFAHLNPGDTILLTTPCYPAYLGATALAQLDRVDVPLVPENGFQPEWEKVPADKAQRAKMLTINYPHNPTGAVEAPETYERTLAFARRHDICVVSDIAYCDLPMDDDYEASSFLQVDRNKERTVEFHSFSKSYSMQGWRIGFCAGNAELIANLARIKANMDFSIFMAVQRAARAALDTPSEYCPTMGRLYATRRDVMSEGLTRLGFRFHRPRAGMYLWPAIPAGYQDSMQFTADLLEKTGVLVSPGSAFGPAGEGFVRIALCEEEDRLREAIARMEKAGVAAEAVQG
jgi:LL-diaminopimelate aminotransferase